MAIETIEVKLKRNELEEDFMLEKSQVFETSYRVSPGVFTKVEKAVNDVCKSKEMFVAKAIVNVHIFLVYNHGTTTLSSDIELTGILNYDNDNLLQKPIKFSLSV